MEGEDFTASEVGFQGVRELGRLPCRLIGEWEREVVVREILRKPKGVFAGLGLHTLERKALGLGLHDADRLPVRVQEVVRKARVQRELTDGDAQPFAQVDCVGILNDPTSIPKVLVR